MEFGKRCQSVNSCYVSTWWGFLCRFILSRRLHSWARSSVFSWKFQPYDHTLPWQGLWFLKSPPSPSTLFTPPSSPSLTPLPPPPPPPPPLTLFFLPSLLSHIFEDFAEIDKNPSIRRNVQKSLRNSDHNLSKNTKENAKIWKSRLIAA